MRLSSKSVRARLLIGASAAVLALSAGAAMAQDHEPINIAPQSLTTALQQFGSQTATQVMFTPALVAAKKTGGVSAVADEQLALAQLLQGTGLTFRREGNVYLIEGANDPQSGSAAGDGADGTVQALVVTAQKREENIQDVPIAMSAFTQEDLTRSQVAGGPDLMTQVPNFTFTKTNFTGYSIQIRGIGTQAISATTDAAVAVALNNTPFIRNRFFEQEFYDLQRVEVLRGPQGTLYGRNATAGVVNIISAKPSFRDEARLSADVGNYNSTRFEGMVNMPLVDDKVAVRLAGAWTKRDGYDTNQITGAQIDGRDLWSTRLSLRVAPTDNLDVNLIWEHFQENDDRLRSGKQLCHTDNRTVFDGHELTKYLGSDMTHGQAGMILSQGCLPVSLYSPDAFQVPNGYSLPYYDPLAALGLPVPYSDDGGHLHNPYVSTTQSRDLRTIESTVDPHYRARSDLAELQWKVDLGNALTLASETAYGVDFIFSTEDFNRFNTSRDAFDKSGYWRYGGEREGLLTPGEFGSVFCDPQVGCSDRLVAIDLSTARSRQFSQEFRLSSDFSGPLNFSFGANFLRYDTEDKYYVFFNSLTLFSGIAQYRGIGTLPQYGPISPWVPGVSDNHECLTSGLQAPDPNSFSYVNGCVYIDPNPIGQLNDQGHNYFLSKNPYKLISYAAFGEGYYDIAPSLKLTAGLRWTIDKKESPRIPSWVLASDSAGYPVAEVVRQRWSEPTGRLALDWKPDLSLTDQTLFYASYARGYKAGGTNPPPAGVVIYSSPQSAQALLDESVTKPKVFKPEFVNAFEAGTKNTLLDGALTLNASAFYYDYQGYQISQIVDRSAVNYNFDAKVWGLEFEGAWRPVENLALGLKLGYERTRVADGSRAIDIMDRTAGHAGWMVVRPFPTFTSNCVVPSYLVFDNAGELYMGPYRYMSGNMGPCEDGYLLNHDPLTALPYNPDDHVTSADGGHIPYSGYRGFDPSVDYGNNHGEGFYKDLSGHELPNAPHITATVTADYTLPLPNDWLMTLHSDFYYQSEAWSRIFNTPGYDKLKAYTNLNLAAIFSNEDAGWKVMAYVKNVFDHDSITGAFLNSDDTGLTTNVFLNEPRLYGLRVTKEWTGQGWWTGANPNHTGPYPLTVEIGGQVQRQDAPYSAIVPSFAGAFSDTLDLLPAAQNRRLDRGDGREIKVAYRGAGSPWSLAGEYRYGKTNSRETRLHAQEAAGAKHCGFFVGYQGCYSGYNPSLIYKYATNFSDSTARNSEEHEIVEFEVGRDVKLGAAVDTRVAVGLRGAHLTSETSVTLAGVPDWQLVDSWLFVRSSHTRDQADLTTRRKFEGAGPVLSVEGTLPIIESKEAGVVGISAAVTGGVLFGKQNTSADGFEQIGVYNDKYQNLPQTPVAPPTRTPVNAHRSSSATVPVLDASLGLSYEIQRIKLSTGYRWERYFNVLDGGYQEHKSYDRTIDGPYFKIAVGFGG